jgi:hypothetical protein
MGAINFINHQHMGGLWHCFTNITLFFGGSGFQETGVPAKVEGKWSQIESLGNTEDRPGSGLAERSGINGRLLTLWETYKKRLNMAHL